MGMVLRFRARTPRLAPAPGGTAGGKGADVLLFTGVRYERDVGAQGQAKPARKIRRTREG